MSKAIKVIESLISAGKTIAGNDDIQKMILGTYSDGSPRSLPDALNDEFISPKEKKNILYGDKKKKKKHKKKKSVKFKL